MRPGLLMLLALAVPAATLDAAGWGLRLDPGATRVGFTLQATLHTVEGTIPLKDGVITFDAAGGAASGRLVLDATGARTGNESRDRRMHAEVLESVRFPEIVLTVQRAEIRADAAGQGTVTLVGTLAIHGGEHPFTIEARVRREGERAFAEGDLTVPYVAWGMTDPGAFLLRVAKEVQVHFAASGTLTPPEGP
ncbi:MAG: YceI family protein [Thermoanaerobaculaceae bacterium]|nr:YceI family protein [Thermoanaerobaculaceae bacterium]